MRSFLLVVMLLCTSILHAQDCKCPPSMVAGLEHRPNPVYYDKVKCATNNEETSCVFACNYVLRSDPTYEIIVTVSWVKNVRTNTNYRCNSLLPGYNLGSSTRYAWAKTYLSKGRADLNAEAKALAQNLIEQVEPYSALCPGVTVNTGNTGNNSGTNNTPLTCNQYAERLANLSLQNDEINEEISYLERYKEKENFFRELLSQFNKLIAAMNTPGYNGEHKELLDKFNDPSYRASEAKFFGVKPGLDAPAMIRSIREVLITRVDYLANSPGTINRLKLQQLKLETDIAKIRTSMDQQQCGGRYDRINCNIGGNWKLTFYRDNHIEREESWEFSPSSTAKYIAYGSTGNMGEAEVFGKEIIFRSSVSGAAVNQKILLKEGCNFGNGVARISGNLLDSFHIVARREQPINTVFIQDKIYNLRYDQQVYQAQYQSDLDGNLPLDVFFFKIYATNGSQAEQDGNKLWGRFVRKPAASHPDQSAAQWMLATWIYINGRWVQENKFNLQVEIL